MWLQGYKHKIPKKRHNREKNSSNHNNNNNNNTNKGINRFKQKQF